MKWMCVLYDNTHKERQSQTSKRQTTTKSYEAKCVHTNETPKRKKELHLKPKRTKQRN